MKKPSKKNISKLMKWVASHRMTKMTPKQRTKVAKEAANARYKK